MKKNYVNFPVALIAIMAVLLSSCSKNEQVAETETAGLANIKAKAKTAATGTVTDIDGNVYNTITIGTQTWMTQNLKTTRYNDGTAIQQVTGNTQWNGLTTGAYCFYNNNSANNASYGKLYNWYAVNTGKLAPTGWHVPTSAEWNTLISFLGGEAVAGGKLKQMGLSYWISPNTGATNSSGFTGLPGGFRQPAGTFVGLGQYGLWWTGTAQDATSARYAIGWYNNDDANNLYDNKKEGFSVVCISDSGTPPPSVPAPAASAGYNRLTFNDDFNSLSTIDVNRTKAPGYKWYADQPFGGGTTQTANFAVNSGVLTISPITGTANGNLYSYSPGGNTGSTFKKAYFEARMKFNPALGPNSSGFPAFWSLSTKHLTTNNLDIWAELDFFEAYTGGYAAYNGQFVGTIHDWRNSSTTHWQNSNNWIAGTGIDGNWHTYGCLWQTGKVTWYLDGVAKITQLYSASAPPNPLANGTITPTPAGVFNILDTDPQGMALILGSGPNWPIDVDYVKVWQQ